MISSGGQSAEWVFERWRGGAALLHKRPLMFDGRRRLAVMEVTRPALVLGSTTSLPDHRVGPGEGVDVVRRRSGGGVVWLAPGESTWLDVTVPRHDPLWDDDIGRSFLWLSRTIADALEDLGVRTILHTGGHVAGQDGSLVCFAGRGAGELLVGPRKLVGMAQRRTRAAARIQCVWYRSWSVSGLAAMVGDEVAERCADVGVGMGAVTAVDPLPAVIEAIQQR